MMTTRTDVTTEALTTERDRLTTLRDSVRPGSSDYWTHVAALAQVEAELIRREIPQREEAHAAAEARVAAMRPTVDELAATYEAAKQAAEDGPGAAYREAKYDLDLAIERARNADGNRGALGQARYRLKQATQEYHAALERKEAADELARRQEVRRIEARAERERREARQQPKALPEVPAPDLVAR